MQPIYVKVYISSEWFRKSQKWSCSIWIRHSILQICLYIFFLNILYHFLSTNNLFLLLLTAMNGRMPSEADLRYPVRPTERAELPLVASHLQGLLRDPLLRREAGRETVRVSLGRKSLFHVLILKKFEHLFSEILSKLWELKFANIFQCLSIFPVDLSPYVRVDACVTVFILHQLYDTICIHLSVQISNENFIQRKKREKNWGIAGPPFHPPKKNKQSK